MKRIFLNTDNTFISLDEAYEEFEIYCKAKNLRPKTINYYNQTIKYFDKYFNTYQPCNLVNQNTIIRI